MWVGDIFSLNFQVQKLSNLSIELHLGEADTRQCLLSLYDLQEGYHDRPGGGQDHQDATGSQSCFFMFNGYVLKIKHAIPNASLISQCWLSKGLEMTNHFTISQHNITKPVMYQIEISSLIYLNGSQLEN